MQLNAGGGDGNGVSRAAAALADQFGDETGHQVGHGFSSADLGFVQGDISSHKALVHSVGHGNLIFPDVVSGIGQQAAEDQVDPVGAGDLFQSSIAAVTGVFD